MTDAPDAVAQRRALFVTHPSHISDARGGVQKCSFEFIAALRLAGFVLNVHPIREDRRPSTRIARQFLTNPYLRPVAPADAAMIRAKAEGADIVFVNQAFLADAVVRALGADAPPVVILSHGCEITDFLHFVRLRGTLPLSGRVRPTAAVALGAILDAEVKARRGVAATIAMSPADADLERWLGVPAVTFVPRTITPVPLDWAPVAGRFGTVGTLDHAPNLEGLVAVLAALPPDAAVRIRIVGGPERLGTWLAARHRAVEYLGRLDDTALTAEAATWQAFLHPIFCSARGASTKLAQPIEWGIPILTTPMGRRGYQWSDGSLIEVDDAPSLVRAMLEGFDLTRTRDAVIAVAETSPRLSDVASHLAPFLDHILSERTKTSRNRARLAPT